MQSSRVALVVASCIAAAVFAHGPTPSAQNEDRRSGYERLEMLGRDGGSLPSAETLSRTASVLAETSLLKTYVAPASDATGLVGGLTDLLTTAQAEWVADRPSKSVSVEPLADRMNSELDLVKAPEFMRVRPEQLTRLRVHMWWRMPSFMVSSPSRADARMGAAIADGPMSPFEAFVVADSLLYEKLYNDDYLRTAEEVAAFPVFTSGRRPPGIYQLRNSERRDAFEAHLATLAKSKWPSALDALTSVRNLLEVQP